MAGGIYIAIGCGRTSVNRLQIVKYDSQKKKRKEKVREENLDVIGTHAHKQDIYMEMWWVQLAIEQPHRSTTYGQAP